jgi:hypothetical protein
MIIVDLSPQIRSTGVLWAMMILQEVLECLSISINPIKDQERQYLLLIFQIILGLQKIKRGLMVNNGLQF